ncbi:MAG: hypothetical protein Q8J89_09555 [Caulobacter sp.]|nr:hypothetical protein [Caulobacter sp.]
MVDRDRERWPFGGYRVGRGDLRSSKRVTILTVHTRLSAGFNRDMVVRSATGAPVEGDKVRLRTKMIIRTLVLAGLVGIAVPALADPCRAIPDRGPLPAYLGHGSVFSGPVVYIGDGDSLCVAVGSGQENWVEVRVAEFYAPELNTPEGKRAKATLERLVKGQLAVCRAEKRSYDRIVARCEVGRRPIEELMEQAGVPSGGNGAPLSRSPN